MKNREAIRYKHRLDNLFKKASAMTSDIELQSHWSRYLCVLVSGFLEVSVSSIYSEYTLKRANQNISNYVTQRLDGFQNPNMTKIVNLTSAFNQDWGAELEKQTKGALKNSIDSICANRNLIAHGKDTGITYTRLYGWYQDAIQVVEMLEKQCGL
jgi:hypothetical protein